MPREPGQHRPRTIEQGWLGHDGNRSSREALLEVLALDELEREEGLAVGLLEPVDRGGVRVVERGEQIRLALEAPEPLGVLRDLGRQDLDRHVAVEVRVGADAVVRERLADQLGQLVTPAATSSS
jgi:hypothetical protein